MGRVSGHLWVPNECTCALIEPLEPNLSDPASTATQRRGHESKSLHASRRECFIQPMGRACRTCPTRSGTAQWTERVHLRLTLGSRQRERARDSYHLTGLYFPHASAHGSALYNRWVELVGHVQRAPALPNGPNECTCVLPRRCQRVRGCPTAITAAQSGGRSEFLMFCDCIVTATDPTQSPSTPSVQIPSRAPRTSPRARG